MRRETYDTFVLFFYFYVIQALFENYWNWIFFHFHPSNQKLGKSHKERVNPSSVHLFSTTVSV